MNRPICLPPRASGFQPASGIALADFDAFEQLQSKAGLAELLTRLKVPQPATEIGSIGG